MTRTVHSIGLSFFLFSMILIAFGCGNSPMNPSGDPSDGVMGALDDTDLFETYFGDDPICDFYEDVAEIETDSPIDPVAFYRLLNTPERTYDIEIEGDKAWGTVYYNVTGQLALELEEGETIYKDINDDRGRRYVELEKKGDDWEVTKVSVLKGYSEGAYPEIYVVRVQASEVDTTFDSFDAMHDLDVLTFGPDEPVMVYAFVRDSTDVAIMHHLDRKCIWGHRVMEHQGYGLFVSEYEANNVPGGTFYQYVDVIDRESLLDDEAPYRAAAWSMPYRIREE